MSRRQSTSPRSAGSSVRMIGYRFAAAPRVGDTFSVVRESEPTKIVKLREALQALDPLRAILTDYPETSWYQHVDELSLQRLHELIWMHRATEEGVIQKQLDTSVVGFYFRDSMYNYRGTDLDDSESEPEPAPDDDFDPEDMGVYQERTIRAYRRRSFR